MDSQKNTDSKKAVNTIRMLKKIGIICIVILIIVVTINHFSLGTVLKKTSGIYPYYILMAMLFCIALFLKEKPAYILMDRFFYNAFDQNYIPQKTTQNSEKKTYRRSVVTQKTLLQKEKSPRNDDIDTSIPYLNEIFAEFEEDLNKAPIQTISVLSYFATSLFEKNNIDDVLWDIVENCISRLYLEDCVIYMFDKEKEYLLQKAAFGNKNNGQKKVVSPIKIKVGEGIVGHVAKSGKYQSIHDVTQNPAYIIDDASRMSELSVPIFIEDKIVGVLDSEHSEKDFFTNDHIFLFHLIAKLTEKKLKQIYSTVSCTITNDNRYYKELDFLMKEAKIYRDPSLGLDSMAKKLNISGNYLSQLVNKISGYSFTDYVNRYRIEDAKSKLKDSKFVNYTIISIGLESGFNSKSTFYSAFKKQMGISPKVYRTEKVK